MVSDRCVVVQLVGFARPDDHLPLYMDTMNQAGFEEFDFQGMGNSALAPEDFWRSVPNRKVVHAAHAGCQASFRNPARAPRLVVQRLRLP